MSATPTALDMGAILADRSNRVVVCCGAGGVGKTTTAAAMALRAAEYGRTVVVLDHRPGEAPRPGARHQGPRQYAAAGAARARGDR